MPTANQVECHPYLQQTELKNFCKVHGILFEAYSPLMSGTKVLQDPVIQEIANQYGKTQPKSFYADIFNQMSLPFLKQ